MNEPYYIDEDGRKYSLGNIVYARYPYYLETGISSSDKNDNDDDEKTSNEDDGGGE